MGQTRTNPEWPWVADAPKQMTSVIIRALMMSPQASRRSHQAQGGRGDAGRNARRTLPRDVEQVPRHRPRRARLVP